MLVTQLHLTLCDPMDHTVPGILQARILEWVAFPFSRDLPNPEVESRSPTLQAILYQLSHREACYTAVHGITKNRTRLSN